MTVIGLLFIVMLAILVVALLSIPASPCLRASLAYIDNIASFFGNNSPHPTIRISGWIKPVSTARDIFLSAMNAFRPLLPMRDATQLRLEAALDEGREIEFRFLHGGGEIAVGMGAVKVDVGVEVGPDFGDRLVEDFGGGGQVGAFQVRLETDFKVGHEHFEDGGDVA